MFEETAGVYDAFYDALEKDYEWEARRVLRLSRAVCPKPRTLLDVACGTGRHLDVFRRKLDCVGVDLDPAMLAVAATRCPDVRFVAGDMVDFDLGQRFDIVTCLFSSIGYVRTVPRLRRAVRTMARHVSPGGVLAVEPWYQPEDWEVGHLSVLVVDEPGCKATRVSRSSRRGDLSTLEFEYLIADAAGIRHYQERHEMRLFRWEHYLDAFAAVGFTADVDEYGLFGRGLVVGTAR